MRQKNKKESLQSELTSSRNKTYSRRSNKLLGTSLAIVSRLHFHPGVSLEWFVRQISPLSLLTEGSWRQNKNNSDYLCPSGTPVLLSRAKVLLYLLLFLEPDTSSKQLVCVNLIAVRSYLLSLIHDQYSSEYKILGKSSPYNGPSTYANSIELFSWLSVSHRKIKLY